MKFIELKSIQVLFFTCLSVFIISQISLAGSETVDFKSERWDLTGATISEYLGRESLQGIAILKDVEFENGVIEVDVAVTGVRSYPGIVFRVQDEKNAERFYIRPHRSGLYADVHQYTPIINGVSPWQLYHGDGATAAGVIPKDEWIHVRIEVHGTQARVFVNDGENVALQIHQLKHGLSTGTIGLYGPKNGTAYFSNFSYSLDNNLSFEAPAEMKVNAKAIDEWEISRAFPANRLNLETFPRFYTIFFSKWKKVKTEPSGLLDFSKHLNWKPNETDAVFARTKFFSDKRQLLKMNFGYSDNVSVFLNGAKVFQGNSPYRGRDGSFLGIVGLHDAVYLPLEKGLNDIFCIVTESFGGWGLMAELDKEVAPVQKNHARLQKVWETDDVFKVPESVLYDEKRDILYVSSFDKVQFSNKNTGFISRISRDGQIKDLEWITGLDGPCGMGLHGDQLYVVECTGNLVEIDAVKGEILKRHAIPGSRFLNDMTVGPDGTVYITDTSPPLSVNSEIYAVREGKVESWQGGDVINRANGLFYHDGELFVGNSGDSFFKGVSLESKHIRNITCLSAGIIDGIRIDNSGNFVVSHWQGLVYSISPDGTVTEILDLSKDGMNTADFEFVKQDDLLVIPTFLGNKVVAYKIVDN